MKSFYELYLVLCEEESAVKTPVQTQVQPQQSQKQPPLPNANKWMWGNGMYQYAFQTQSTGENYIVEARPWTSQSWWNITFHLMGDANPNLHRIRSAPIEKGGSGEAPNVQRAKEVMMKTMYAMREFKDNAEKEGYPIAGFVFSAGEESRQGAYDAFVNRFAKGMGFTSEKRGKEYYLSNQNYKGSQSVPHLDDDDMDYISHRPSSDLPPLSLDHFIRNLRSGLDNIIRGA